MPDAPPRTIRHPELEPAPRPAPVPPAPPGLDDCCRSGCVPCVFDLYEEAMERYRIELARYQKRHPAG